MKQSYDCDTEAMEFAATADGKNLYPPTIRKRTDLHLFHHKDSLGFCQSTEQGDYKRLI
jgi:hypothetical protein